MTSSQLRFKLIGSYLPAKIVKRVSSVLDTLNKTYPHALLSPSSVFQTRLPPKTCSLIVK